MGRTGAGHPVLGLDRRDQAVL
ncbi:hypothetical protein RB2654_14635 [Rhodobacterales bacterium HTCC2654]|uniref:Uncharacterized protein n=1 Tax=Maritimibacter alkaliphilus HTCC2654 TaxID=314271 RepID=A3VGX6_9RHOB|nr:hypothetical protein RB2654_14635 [Rhodobacterales bacterium HTCC2654] [Maritimibacter alkaliphilus HTCC2654]